MPTNIYYLGSSIIPPHRMKMTISGLMSSNVHRVKKAPSSNVHRVKKAPSTNVHRVKMAPKRPWILSRKFSVTYRCKVLRMFSLDRCKVLRMFSLEVLASLNLRTCRTLGSVLKALTLPTFSSIHRKVSRISSLCKILTLVCLIKIFILIL